MYVWVHELSFDGPLSKNKKIYTHTKGGKHSCTKRGDKHFETERGGDHFTKGGEGFVMIICFRLSSPLRLEILVGHRALKMLFAKLMKKLQVVLWGLNKAIKIYQP